LYLSFSKDVSNMNDQRKWEMGSDGKIYWTHNSGEPVYTILYAQALKRKRIDDTLASLHGIQGDMIEELVAQSDLKEAKEAIKRIMERGAPRKP
jgi:hypothetical protein